MAIDARLAELGIELPEAPKPVGNYVGGVQVGNLLFMSVWTAQARRQLDHR